MSLKIRRGSNCVQIFVLNFAGNVKIVIHLNIFAQYMFL